MVPVPWWWFAGAAAGNGSSPSAPATFNLKRLKLIGRALSDCPRQDRFNVQIETLTNSLIRTNRLREIATNEWVVTSHLFVETRNPGIYDDAAHGYTVGDRWYNPDNGFLFYNTDDTTGGADWVGSPTYPSGSDVFDDPNSPNRYVTAEEVEDAIDAIPSASTGSDLAYHTHVGYWYIAGMQGVVRSQQFNPYAFSSDILYAVPFVAPRGGTVGTIGVYCSGFASAAAKARLGIYEATSATNLAPSALTVDGGEVALSGTGTRTVTVSKALTASKLYYLAVVLKQDVNTNILRLVTDGSLYAFSTPLGFADGADWDAEATAQIGWSAASTYGALPSPFPAATIVGMNSTTLPAIGVKFSA